MIHNLSDTDSIVHHYLAELRNLHVQNDRLRFRMNLERMGKIFAYEISKHFTYHTSKVSTLLGEAVIPHTTREIVLSTILRAGLPLHQGLLSFFDKADNAFVSAYRKHEADGSFTISMQYITCPSLDDTILIISDPMLATGASMKAVLEGLKKYGKPAQVHLVTVIASQEGVNYITKLYPDCHLWVGAIDPFLNKKSYIVPGLGDAGDLAFGTKLQE